MTICNLDEGYEDETPIKRTWKVAEKPPLGIKPRHIHDLDRACNLVDAIQRYHNARIHIPEAWWKELRELVVRGYSK